MNKYITQEVEKNQAEKNNPQIKEKQISAQTDFSHRKFSYLHIDSSDIGSMFKSDLTYHVSHDYLCGITPTEILQRSIFS